MKTELTKITIEVGGKKLEFSPEEAKELKKILSGLFGEESVKHIYHYDYYRTWPYTITCSGGTTNAYTTAATASATYAGTNWTGTYSGGNVTLTSSSGSNQGQITG